MRTRLGKRLTIPQPKPRPNVPVPPVRSQSGSFGHYLVPTSTRAPRHIRSRRRTLMRRLGQCHGIPPEIVGRLQRLPRDDVPITTSVRMISKILRSLRLGSLVRRQPGGDAWPRPLRVRGAAGRHRLVRHRLGAAVVTRWRSDRTQSFDIMLPTTIRSSEATGSSILQKTSGDRACAPAARMVGRLQVVWVRLRSSQEKSYPSARRAITKSRARAPGPHERRQSVSDVTSRSDVPGSCSRR